MLFASITLIALLSSTAGAWFGFRLGVRVGLKTMLEDGTIRSNL